MVKTSKKKNRRKRRNKTKKQRGGGEEELKEEELEEELKEEELEEEYSPSSSFDALQSKMGTQYKRPESVTNWWPSMSRKTRRGLKYVGAGALGAAGAAYYFSDDISDYLDLDDPDISDCDGDPQNQWCIEYCADHGHDPVCNPDDGAPDDPTTGGGGETCSGGPCQAINVCDPPNSENCWTCIGDSAVDPPSERDCIASRHWTQSAPGAGYTYERVPLHIPDQEYHLPRCLPLQDGEPPCSDNECANPRGWQMCGLPGWEHDSFCRIYHMEPCEAGQEVYIPPIVNNNSSPDYFPHGYDGPPANLPRPDISIELTDEDLRDPDRTIDLCDPTRLSIAELHERRCLGLRAHEGPGGMVNPYCLPEGVPLPEEYSSAGRLTPGSGHILTPGTGFYSGGGDPGARCLPPGVFPPDTRSFESFRAGDQIMIDDQLVTLPGWLADPMRRGSTENGYDPNEIVYRTDAQGKGHFIFDSANRVHHGSIPQDPLRGTGFCQPLRNNEMQQADCSDLEHEDCENTFLTSDLQSRCGWVPPQRDGPGPACTFREVMQTLPHCDRLGGAIGSGPDQNCTTDPSSVAEDGYCGQSSPQCPGVFCRNSGAIMLDDGGVDGDECYLTFRPGPGRAGAGPAGTHGPGINSWGEFYAAYLRHKYNNEDEFPEHNRDFPTVSASEAVDLIRAHRDEFEGVEFSPGCSN